MMQEIKLVVLHFKISVNESWNIPRLALKHLRNFSLWLIEQLNKDAFEQACMFVLRVKSNKTCKWKYNFSGYLAFIWKRGLYE
jgi:hypothetical protein